MSSKWSLESLSPIVPEAIWGMPPHPPSRHAHTCVRELAFTHYYHPATILYETLKPVEVFPNVKQTKKYQYNTMLQGEHRWHFCLLFYQLFDWATRQGAPKDRLITFYHLANRWETATQSQKTRLYHSTAVRPLLVLQRSWSICSFSLRVTSWRMLLSYWKATVKEGKVSLDTCSFPRMCGQNPSGSPKLVHTTRNVWIGAPSKLMGHTPGLLRKLLTITLTTKQRQAKPYLCQTFPLPVNTYLRHPHRAEVLCITRGKTRASRYWRFLRLTVGCSLKLHNSHCLYSSTYVIIFMTSWPIRFQLVLSLEYYGFSKYPAPPIVVAKQLTMSCCYLHIFNSRSTILPRWWCMRQSMPPLRSPSPVPKEVLPLWQRLLPFQGEVRDSSETFGESGESTTFGWQSWPETLRASLLVYS